MPVLLGLSGRRGHGKDTAFGIAHDWAAERGLLARRRGFADALKLSFARLFIPDASIDEGVAFCDEIKTDLSRSELTLKWTRDFNTSGHTETTITHKITGRMAQQRFGTEGHRDVFGDDFWVDVLLPLSTIINEYDLPEGPRWPINFMGQLDQAAPDLCAVTDCRFENEAKRIRQLGGKIIKITATGAGALQDPHSSEKPLPKELVDYHVENEWGEPQRMGGQLGVILNELLPPDKGDYDEYGKRGEL